MSIPDPNYNIDRTVDNFSGSQPERSDLAPAIVYLVVVCPPTLRILHTLANGTARSRSSSPHLEARHQEESIPRGAQRTLLGHYQRCIIDYEGIHV